MSHDATSTLKFSDEVAMRESENPMTRDEDEEEHNNNKDDLSAYSYSEVAAINAYALSNSPPAHEPQLSPNGITSTDECSGSAVGEADFHALMSKSLPHGDFVSPVFDDNNSVGVHGSQQPVEVRCLESHECCVVQ